MSDQGATSAQDSLLAGYVTETQVAAARNVSPRTLRAERQKGVGPSYVKVGKSILYPVDGFRAWLKSNERQPVRAGRAA
jgi:hypothetical protein